MHKIFRAVLFVLFFSGLVYQTAAAQPSPELPVYIVQSGDTLSIIAQRFSTTVDDLIKVNNLTNPNILSVGTELKIPGLDGITCVLTTMSMGIGDTIRSTVIRNDLTTDQVIRLNRVVIPTRLFAGNTLIIPKKTETSTLHPALFPETDDTYLDTAIALLSNPWQIKMENHSNGFWDLLPSEVLFTSTKGEKSSSLISPYFTNFEIGPTPIYQGKTLVIKIKSSIPLDLTGEIAGQKITFIKQSAQNYIALQGIHAMLTPGIYPFKIKGNTSGKSPFSFEQMVVVQSAGYGSMEYISGVDPKTIDPANTVPEDNKVLAVTTVINPEKYWDGQFKNPSYFPDVITSYFGRPRSYNNGAFTYFHSGIDFGYGNKLPIYSPAHGKVVFAESTIVRGNAVIIDHGWGIYSGLWHQSEIKVKVGETVVPGQIIGLVGNTGRSNGSHLHWEVWAGGVQVDPMDWLKKIYP